MLRRLALLRLVIGVCLGRCKPDAGEFGIDTGVCIVFDPMVSCYEALER
jgi:hypothetical protein